jgi:peptidyl-prolyl cis-trans isomerase C
VRDSVGVAGSTHLCHASGMRGYLLCVAALALCACKPNPGPGAKGAAGSGPVLARVDDTEITASDLQEVLARYAHTPFVLARYSTPGKKKELLDSLVRYELMAREALRRGYDRDPDVQRIAKKQMVALFEKREINDKLRAEDVAPADVETYYREHQSEFVRPEEVRVSQILVHDEAAARRIAAEAKARRNDPKSFRDLVERYSEDADSKPRAGDLTFFDRKTTREPKALVEAAFAMSQVNDVVGPIASDKGLHILKLTDRRAETTRTLAEAKVDIQKRLLDQMRAQKKRELTDETRKSIRVEIYEDELAKIAVAPAADGGRPPTVAPVPSSAPTPAPTPKP